MRVTESRRFLEGAQDLALGRWISGGMEKPRKAKPDLGRIRRAEFQKGSIGSDSG